MGLNVSKGNMYDWVTHTWNTIKGKCPHRCSYCYMSKWGMQKPPRFDEKELKTDLGSDNFIFVGSSCDLFAKDIPEKWIIDTLNYCRNFNNSYLFQTKNPTGFIHFIDDLLTDSDKLSPYSVICTTIETNRYYIEMGIAPLVADRAEAMDRLQLAIPTYVTIEPIMDFDLNELVRLINQCHPERVNIGADSCGKKLTEPPKGKILELIEALEEFTTVKQKSNLKRLLK